jgi:hypothetical protein
MACPDSGVEPQTARKRIREVNYAVPAQGDEQAGSTTPGLGSGLRPPPHMIGAGTIINPIIKIVTTVVILGACYLFFVKPVLDTTENTFEQFGLGEFSETFEGLPTDLQDQIDAALDSGGRSEASRLGDCITRAQPDTAKINRCVERFTP